MDARGSEAAEVHGAGSAADGRRRPRRCGAAGADAAGSRAGAGHGDSASGCHSSANGPKPRVRLQRNWLGQR